jgi:phosphinothricin acetyltransferase
VSGATASARIRPCSPQDAAAVAAIYAYYIRETVVTFEETPVSAAAMARRIEEIATSLPWLVWDESSAVLGYAYAAPWKQRSAYRFTAETTVYVAENRRGRGIGGELYAALLDELRGRGLHSAVGCIALPNPASIALHEKLGFKEIGRFEEAGWKFGRWVDVGYWQVML